VLFSFPVAKLSQARNLCSPCSLSALVDKYHHKKHVLMMSIKHIIKLPYAAHIDDTQALPLDG
jgi:hypothetical protein